MRVLIIKTGECETFDTALRLPIVSLGDVLRSTVLLSLYSDVDWYGSPESERLLFGNRIVGEINAKNYDLVINLENDEKIFKYLEDNTLGFISHNVLKLADGEKIGLFEFLEKYRVLNWSEKLFRIVGAEWRGERPNLIGRRIDKRNDVGLNWKVGPKWPAKDWGKDKWIEVSKLLERSRKVSWQQGFDNLEVYIEWIQGCRVLLTHDSLGLHIAQALKIPVVALFGPTSVTDIPKYDNDVFLNFKNPPYLTSEQAHEILDQVILRSENESSVRR